MPSHQSPWCRWRTNALTFFGIVWLAGCQGNPPPENATTNPWLEHIEHQSGVVVVNQKPLPEAVLDQWLRLAQASIGATLEPWLKRYPTFAQMLDSLATADQWRNAGLDPAGFFALYQDRGHLVWQIPLQNHQSFIDWWSGFEIQTSPSDQALSLNAPVVLDTTTSSAIDHVPTQMAVGVYQDHLTVAWGPSARELLVATDTSQDHKPEDPWTDQRWQSFNQQHHFDGHLSGYIDVNQALSQSSMVSDGCRDDWQQASQPLTKLVFGAHSLDRQRSLWRFETQFSEIDWPKAQTRQPQIDVSQADQAAVAGIGLTFDVAALRQALLARSPIERDPSSPCPTQDLLDQQQRMARAVANRPIPPLLTSIFGVSSRFDGLENRQDPKSATFLTEVYLNNPRFLLGLAQLFSPQLAQMNLNPNQAPARVPDELTQAFGTGEMYLSTTPTSIRASSNADPEGLAISQDRLSLPSPMHAIPWFVGTLNFERMDELALVLERLPVIQPDLIEPLGQWAVEANLASMRWRAGHDPSRLEFMLEITHPPAIPTSLTGQ